MNLNEKQQQAVNTIEGPLLIIAGAGSGKTTVLTERTAHMIQSGIKPENILAVAFSNKAVNEMKERIGKKIGKEKANDITISTFHTFCIQFLKEEGEESKRISPYFRIPSTFELKQNLKQIIESVFTPEEMNESDSAEEKKQKKETNDFFRVSNIARLIALFKSEMIVAQNLAKKNIKQPYIDLKKAQILIKEVGREHFTTFVQIFQKYDEFLKKNEFLDLEDVLVYAALLIIENEEVREKYQEKFRYILIDEYQDTNQAQYVFIKALASKYRNLAAVGDESQSIFRFRGSDIRNILNFEEEYPEALVIKLEENYRSTKTILDAANALIAHNKEKKEKTLYTTKTAGEKIKLHVAELNKDEADFIADKIEAFVKEGRSYKDMAVFYRNNSDSATIERVLQKRGIPFKLSRDGGFFEQEEIVDLLAYLSFIIDPTHVAKFKKIINKPKRGIGKTTVDKIIEKANGGDLLAICRKSDELERINAKTKEGLLHFVDVIDSLHEVKGDISVAEMIQEILKKTNYEECFADLEKSLQRTKKRNIKKLIDEANEMDNFLPMSIHDFLGDIIEKDIEAAAVDEEEWDEVSLTTIHSAKGLEYPIVFIIGMKEQGFPSAYAFTEADIEEERRLCYVAYTRAKELLYLSYPAFHLGEKDEEGEREKISNKPSRFLSEFDSNLIEEI